MKGPLSFYKSVSDVFSNKKRSQEGPVSGHDSPITIQESFDISFKQLDLIKFDLNSLPAEIISKILGYLPANILIQANLVNKNLNQISSSLLYRSIHIIIMPTINHRVSGLNRVSIDGRKPIKFKQYMKNHMINTPVELLYPYESTFELRQNVKLLTRPDQIWSFIERVLIEDKLTNASKILSLTIEIIRSNQDPLDVIRNENFPFDIPLILNEKDSPSFGNYDALTLKLLNFLKSDFKIYANLHNLTHLSLPLQLFPIVGVDKIGSVILKNLNSVCLNSTPICHSSANPCYHISPGMESRYITLRQNINQNNNDNGTPGYDFTIEPNTSYHPSILTFRDWYQNYFNFLQKRKLNYFNVFILPSIQSSLFSVGLNTVSSERYVKLITLNLCERLTSFLRLCGCNKNIEEVHFNGWENFPDFCYFIIEKSLPSSPFLSAIRYDKMKCYENSQYRKEEFVRLLKGGNHNEKVGLFFKSSMTKFIDRIQNKGFKKIVVLDRDSKSTRYIHKGNFSFFDLLKFLNFYQTHLLAADNKNSLLTYYESYRENILVKYIKYYDSGDIQDRKINVIINELSIHNSFQVLMWKTLNPIINNNNNQELLLPTLYKFDKHNSYLINNLLKLKESFFSDSGTKISLSFKNRLNPNNVYLFHLGRGDNSYTKNDHLDDDYSNWDDHENAFQSKFQAERITTEFFDSDHFLNYS